MLSFVDEVLNLDLSMVTVLESIPKPKALNLWGFGLQDLSVHASR